MRNTNDQFLKETRWKRHVVDYFKSPLAAFSFVIALLFIIAAIFAFWLAPQNPYDLGKVDVLDALQPPGASGVAGDQRFLLGSDGQGRDILSSIIYGLRTSLIVGVGASTAAGIIGIFLGLVAAYFGGKTDAFVMREVDLMLSFPSILVAMMILAFLGKGLENVIITLILLEWTYYARTARSQALIERRREYVEAATCLGFSNFRIMIRQILPNCMPPLIVIGTLQIARAITLEATLSFLGVGVDVTEPSLGALINNGSQELLSGRYWISFYPGIALLLLLLSFNLVGDRLREVLNPRSNS